MSVSKVNIDCFLDHGDLFSETINGEQIYATRGGDQLYEILELTDGNKPLGSGVAQIDVDGVTNFTVIGFYVRRIDDKTAERENRRFIMTRSDIASSLPHPKKYSGNLFVHNGIEEVGYLNSTQFLAILEDRAKSAINYRESILQRN